MKHGRAMAGRMLKWGWRAVLAYCVMVAAVRVSAGWSRMHSVADFALYLAGLTFDETIYAPGYSEKAFWTVRPGMSAGEVEGLLGKPLWRRGGAPGEEVWSYTDVRCPEGCVTCPDGFYWKRWVVLDDGEKVVRIEGECWDD